MTNKGFVGFPSTQDVVPDGSITAGKLASPMGWGRLNSGFYYFTSGQFAVSTSLLVNQRLLLTPWIVPNACTLNKIGAEVTTIGESGSKVRLGIYADNGSGYPGGLVLDAGQIAGDSATVQEISINQALPAGLYWIGGAAQSGTTTPPTVRTSNHSAFMPSMQLTSSTPSSAQTVLAYQQASISGALPQVYSQSPSLISSVVRVFVKVA